MPAPATLLNAYVAAERYEAASALRRLLVVDRLAVSVDRCGTRNLLDKIAKV